MAVYRVMLYHARHGERILAVTPLNGYGGLVGRTRKRQVAVVCLLEIISERGRRRVDDGALPVATAAFDEEREVEVVGNAAEHTAKLALNMGGNALFPRRIKHICHLCLQVNGAVNGIVDGIVDAALRQVLVYARGKRGDDKGEAN